MKLILFLFYGSSTEPASASATSPHKINKKLTDALGYQVTLSASDGSMILTVDGSKVEAFMQWRLAQKRYAIFYWVEGN